jgi:hypothetical protein
VSRSLDNELGLINDWHQIWLIVELLDVKYSSIHLKLES